MRIFDNPKHHNYGPVRRLWVILTQLDLLQYSEAYKKMFLMHWDDFLTELMSPTQEGQYSEVEAQREVLQHFLVDLQ